MIILLLNWIFEEFIQLNTVKSVYKLFFINIRLNIVIFYCLNKVFDKLEFLNYFLFGQI